MPLPSQLSLSVELTKVIPLGLMMGAAGERVLDLARKLRRSGSDLLAEEDLASVLGRNRVDTPFAFKFRSAISARNQISNISRFLNLVLEVPGPTVFRALSNDTYLAMVIQISLLHYTHSIDSLSEGLCRALENLPSSGSPQGGALDRTTLQAAIKACGEQTSSFGWDLIFEEVERCLKTSTFHFGPHVANLRALAFPILQGLLDALTTLQHFPDASYLEISTGAGVSTIVTWVHYVLGMAVSVILDGHEERKFGEGEAKIIVKHEWAHSSSTATLTLFSSCKKEVIFHLSDDAHDVPPLIPDRRRRARGYGAYMLADMVHDSNVVNLIAEGIVVSCIQSARDADRMLHGPDATLSLGAEFIPPLNRLTNTATLLFEDLDLDGSRIESLLESPSMFRDGKFNLPPVAIRNWLAMATELQWVPEGSKHLLGLNNNLSPSDHDWRRARVLPRLEALCGHLTRVIVSLSMIDSLEEYSDIPLACDYPIGGTNSSIHAEFSSRSSFEFLAALMFGPVGNTNIDNACVVSKRGWTILLGSMNAEDPCNLQREIFIRRGTPSRAGERRGYVLDSTLDIGHHQSHQHRLFTEILGVPDRPEHQLHGSRQTPLVATNDDAFKVILPFSVQRKVNTSFKGICKLGFRIMQDLQWRSYHLPPCAHPFDLNDVYGFPNDILMSTMAGPLHNVTSAYAAYYSWNPPESNPIVLTMAPGNPAARWALLGIVHGDLSRCHLPGEYSVYVRHEECCLKCALRMIGEHEQNGFRFLIG